MGTIALPSAATDGNATQLGYCVLDTHISSVAVYGDAVCVNAAMEINVLDYNVAVRRRT